MQAEAICAVMAHSFGRCQHARIFRWIEVVGRDECAAMLYHYGLPHC